ncbi:carbonic anhydrase, partial [Paragonimus westermani]
THVVCYNNKLYKSPSEAAGSPSGLAVLAFLNKVEEDVQRGSTQIGILTGLEESIPKVGNPTQTTMIDPFDLSEILSQVQADEYYRYYGSLTTPPCTENVVWTVFRKLIPITPHQAPTAVWGFMAQSSIGIQKLDSKINNQTHASTIAHIHAHQLPKQSGTDKQVFLHADESLPLANCYRLRDSEEPSNFVA